jgi:hypothetical protein
MGSPFHIQVPEHKLSSLRQKLELTTLPDELDDAGWKYGAPLADINRLLSYWKTFDWRKQEALINEELPQFTRDIEVDGGFATLNIHYVHKKSEIENAIPLLFVHGCKWRAIEFNCAPVLNTDIQMIRARKLP